MLQINNFIILLLNKNLFYFYINFSILKNLNNFMLIFNFNKTNLNLLQKNSLIVNNLEKKLFKSFFFIKFTKHFNVFSFKNLFCDYNFLVKNNFYLNKNIYFLNNNIYKNIFNFYNIIYFLTINKNRFLLLDSDYTFAMPLYNYMFSYNSLNTFKDYFFLKSNFFTFKKWLYFYSNFCINFDINLLILFNYKNYISYMGEIQSLDIPLAALVPLNYANDFVDYSLFIKHSYQLDKIIYSTLIAQAYFLGLNFINFKNKIKYLNIFYKFSKVI